MLTALDIVRICAYHGLYGLVSVEEVMDYKIDFHTDHLYGAKIVSTMCHMDWQGEWEGANLYQLVSHLLEGNRVTYAVLCNGFDFVSGCDYARAYAVFEDACEKCRAQHERDAVR